MRPKSTLAGNQRLHLADPLPWDGGWLADDYDHSDDDLVTLVRYVADQGIRPDQFGPDATRLNEGYTIAGIVSMHQAGRLSPDTTGYAMLRSAGIAE